MVLSCGSEAPGAWDGHGTVTDGGVEEVEEEPDGDPISLRLACQSYARARCQLLELCLPNDSDRLFGAIEECHRFFTETCSLAPGNSSDLLVPCLLDLQQMSCDQVEAWDWPSSC